MSRGFLALTLLWAASQALAASPASPVTPCSAPEYRQLDFWLGDWDTFEPDGSGSSQARNRVTAILGGCVIHERYEQTDGLTGESFSIYDAPRKVWNQTWVTNHGDRLSIEGTFKDGALTLEGPMFDKQGKPMTIRGVWKAQGDGVRETATVSKDGGKTWESYFDILFRKHR
jgi:hypothetical protein